MTTETSVEIASCGETLCGILSEPERRPAPGVVLFHGLSNTMHDCPLLEDTARRLAEQGFFTLRFDYFGSGESQGLLRDKTWDTLIGNSVDASRFLRSWPEVSGLGLWGRSLGGTLVPLAARSLETRAVVMASAGVMVTKTLSRERFGQLQRKHEELAALGKTLPGTGAYKGPLELSDGFFAGLQQTQKEVLASMENLSHVLVLGTSPDVKVPLESFAIAINRVREPKRLWIYEGVDHDFGGVEEEAIGEAVSWFKRHML